jgi:hypothetical protein
MAMATTGYDANTKPLGAIHWTPEATWEEELK